MSGIIALFSKQAPISTTALKQGLECLKHRAPDQQQFWISPHKKVGLGQTRLSILERMHGEQPVANGDKTLMIVVNGAFYDCERIPGDLTKWGYRLRSDSDSEMALHLYNEFGTQCLHHLRGEFAFVIWDESNQLLFAARDRLGIKPLYYTFYNDTLYLASEVKALFAAGVPAHWDYESFLQADNGVLTGNRTLFANVYQVPPGYFLLASRYGIQLHRYWDFDYPHLTELQFQKSEEYIEKLRDTLDEAVRLRLRGDVPVGCYLSGGLDSSTILGMATSHQSKPIHAFTVAFDDEAYNEEPIAREMAKQAGAHLHVIPVRQSDLAEHFADAIWHSEMLAVNANTVAKFLLSRAVRDAGYQVVLTGDGSDEIFASYGFFEKDMLRYNSEGQDEQTLKNRREELKRNDNPESSTQALKHIQRTLGFVPAWIEAVFKEHIKSRSFYSPAFMAQFAQHDAYRIFLNQIDIQGQLVGREPVHQSLYLWDKTILPNYLLRRLGDGIEMAHSISARLPFLDHKVVEFVRNIPVSFKISGMTEKYVLQEAARPFIIETIESRSFRAPPSILKPNNALHQLTQDTLCGSQMAKVPFYNQANVIQLLDELPTMTHSQRRGIDSVLMKMLSACILQERFKLT
ncbi:MAG TPA: asparagine synthase (glutamine-hydrolyzing) [Thioploca sp.]|nr:asparagine synthase (glutamine-hydrolyzing) [Thioploca sp.]